MHRISARAFQAKADLEMCTKSIAYLKNRQATLQKTGCTRTAQAVGAEIEYFELRAESAKGMLEAEVGQASE